MAACEFGKWVKKRLVDIEMSQKTLSAITGINEKVISDIIAGRNNKKAHIELIKNVLADEKSA